MLCSLIRSAGPFTCAISQQPAYHQQFHGFLLADVNKDHLVLSLQIPSAMPLHADISARLGRVLTWWHQSERARGPLSERVNCGASRRQAAARPPWPIAAKRSPPSLKHTCAIIPQVLRTSTEQKVFPLLTEFAPCLHCHGARLPPGRSASVRAAKRAPPSLKHTCAAEADDVTAGWVI